MTECVKCNKDLEDYLGMEYLHISFCPACGEELLQEQVKELYEMTTIDEIDGIIREKLLEMFAWEDADLNSDDLADQAWQSENIDGAFFCSNYRADRFVARHSQWVDDALEYATDWYGDEDTCVKMKAECNDKFLVVAFLMATEHYLYQQLDIDLNGGKLTKKKIKEIVRRIKATPYDGEF